MPGSENYTPRSAARVLEMPGQSTLRTRSIVSGAIASDASTTEPGLIGPTVTWMAATGASTLPTASRAAAARGSVTRQGRIDVIYRS